MPPYVAVCSAAGMGHIAPFLSLASTLSSPPYSCTVTLVVIVPLLSSGESSEISSFFSSHPHIHRLDFHVDHLPTLDPNVDPFLLRYVAISRSAPHLARHLSTLSPPLSAAFSDFLFTAGFNTTLPHLPNPFLNYTVSTTSARFLSLMSYLPCMGQRPESQLEIPGLDPYLNEDIPPFFFHDDNMFTSLITSNARYFPLSKGILVNTFESFEWKTLFALQTGNALPELPPIFPIGPLQPSERNGERDELLCWLDEQPEKSVMYVSFGNRMALSRDQILELGAGLERSGRKFLWVVKTSVVDIEDKEDLMDLLGKELHDKLCKKGKVVKQWVSQKEILGHNAVGGFVSHCGWNSVVEAAKCGVPILAWPQFGDQRENARVVEKAGLGVWGWGNEKGVVGGSEKGVVVEAAEIAEKVEMVMGSEELRKSGRRVGEEAKRACEDGGSSRNALLSIIGSLKC